MHAMAMVVNNYQDTPSTSKSNSTFVTTIIEQGKPEIIELYRSHFSFFKFVWNSFRVGILDMNIVPGDFEKFKITTRCISTILHDYSSIKKIISQMVSA